MPEQRYAAMRDASWTASGSAGATKYHIVAEPLRRELSECGTIVFAFHRDNLEAIRAEDVPLSMRCQKPKCRKHWPAAVGVQEAPDAHAVLQQARAALQKTMAAWGGTCAWHADVKAAIAAIDTHVSGVNTDRGGER